MRAMNRKAYKGAGMEGWVARWYTRTRRNDMAEYRQQAGAIAVRLPAGCDLLEVAPGPGFFAVELLKLGDFKIAGLDISHTLVEIAKKNAASAGANIDFRLGNVSAMPFTDQSFDFIYCSAAFKNFSQPVEALDEMYRVLRPGGAAVIVDLAKDTPLAEIDAFVRKSGRNRFDAWLTRWAFRSMLLKRAYTREAFVQMAERSRFGGCEIVRASIGLEVRLGRAAG